MQSEHITNFTVIIRNIGNASDEAIQSRKCVTAVVSGLLRPLRILAMTAGSLSSAPVIASDLRERGNPEPQARSLMASSLAFLVMTILVVLLGAGSAYAQQTQPDDACSAAESGWYRLSGGADLGGEGYLLICDGEQWGRVFGFESDGVLRPQFVNMLSCGDGDAVIYDAATGGMRCDPCHEVVTPGQACSDGSIYAGLSPDGDARMFTTPADAPTGIPWNEGRDGGYVSIPGARDRVTGWANTQALLNADSDIDTPGVQKHLAAEYCAGLTSHGRRDWYLPARDEFDVLCNNQGAIGGFTGSYYWSSTEDHYTAGWYADISPCGSGGSGVKRFTNSVRCVRKN